MKMTIAAAQSHLIQVTTAVQATPINMQCTEMAGRDRLRRRMNDCVLRWCSSAPKLAEYVARLDCKSVLLSKTLN